VKGHQQSLPETIGNLIMVQWLHCFLLYNLISICLYNALMTSKLNIGHQQNGVANT